MRHHTLTLMIGLAAIAVVACAHTREEIHTTTVTGETVPPTVEREVIAVDTAPPPESAPVTRPRLSQTITLGQGTASQYTPAPPPQAGANGAQGQSVVVNNIIVQEQPRYYGYGGYGRPSTFYNNEGRSFGSRGATPQWGSNGWEGARRTAPPGQTPGVGGNWSPAPSYGPATMK